MMIPTYSLIAKNTTCLKGEDIFWEKYLNKIARFKQKEDIFTVVIVKNAYKFWLKLDHVAL